MSPARERQFHVHYAGFGLSLLSSTGLTCCIALLFLAMRPIMDVGGFVAVGGPYEIAHPAPDWVLLFPASMLGLFVFGGLSVALDNRGWGMSLLLPGWMGLFLALGGNFGYYGFNPPGASGLAWGWIVSGVVFWAMALTPVPAIIGRLRSGGPHEAFEYVRRWMIATLSLPKIAPVYLALQALGVALGITVAVQLFAAVVS
ncbi:MAG TPA: hypothetical protein VLQ52_01360 [Coriobacteriia bacterium]|nr:hypothetical protein [Coriobacteriia bacterium]